LLGSIRFTGSIIVGLVSIIFGPVFPKVNLGFFGDGAAITVGLVSSSPKFMCPYLPKIKSSTSLLLSSIVGSFLGGSPQVGLTFLFELFSLSSYFTRSFS
jgi:hypothetical protein